MIWYGKRQILDPCSSPSSTVRHSREPTELSENMESSDKFHEQFRFSDFYIYLVGI